MYSERAIAEDHRSNYPYPMAIHASGDNEAKDRSSDFSALSLATVILGMIAVLLWAAHPFWVSAGMPTTIAELTGT